MEVPSDLSLVKVSEELPIDHANSVTYNPDDNILVITNMNVNVLTVLDPETLEIVEQIHGGKYGFGGRYAIGCSTEKRQYVLKGDGRFYLSATDWGEGRAKVYELHFPYIYE